MPFTLTMPKLSPTMEEGTLTAWHKKEGEYVEAGELLIEVATDKATVEHNALDAGWLRQIILKEGEIAIVNQAVAIFTEEEKESIKGYEAEGVKIQKEIEKVEESQEVARVGSKKVQAQAAAFQQPAFVPESPLKAYTFNCSLSEAQERIPASPLARKLAQEKNLDLSTTKGTGPRGRVIAEDLEKAQLNTVVAFGRQEKPTVQPGTYEEEALTPLRKSIANRLQEAKTFIPHFYLKQTINAEPLIELREQLKRFDVKITYNDCIVRACALALRKHPEVNAGFNSVNQTIIQYKTIDISIAVGIEGGVITPIIRHADYKNVGQLSTEVRALAKRARKGKLDLHEYKGGSFTISNLGMFGVDDFYAVINPPQAAILAVGGIQETGIVKEGKVVPGKVMCLALSADHRVIDGVIAAQFLATLQKYLENPSILLV